MPQPEPHAGPPPQAAAEAALRAGAELLLVAQPLDDAPDVRAWLDALEKGLPDAGLAGFAWRPPDAPLDIGHGVALALRVDRLDHLGPALLDARRRTIALHPDGSPAPAPAFVGGCAFLPDAPLPDHWEPFGTGTWLLPARRLTVHDDGRATLTRAWHRDGEHWTPADIHAHAIAGPHAQPLADGEDQNAFETRVRAALDAIHSGHLRKVVLARSRTVPRQRTPLAVLLLGLGARYPRCTLFAFAPGDGSLFAGVSPETLLAAHDGHIHTMALAGSAPRGTSPDEDLRHGNALLRDPKERQEHRLVVDDIRATAERHGGTLHAPPEPDLLRLHNVQHLHTPFHGTLEQPDAALDLAAALHPTPAVGGQPRDAALDWLRRTEAGARGWYAAPFGAVHAPDRLHLVVALRSALFRGDQAALFAGAGILAPSDPAREYHETRAKMDALRALLAPTEPTEP